MNQKLPTLGPRAINIVASPTYPLNLDHSPPVIVGNTNIYYQIDIPSSSLVPTNFPDFVVLNS